MENQVFPESAGLRGSSTRKEPSRAPTSASCGVDSMEQSAALTVRITSSLFTIRMPSEIVEIILSAAVAGVSVNSRCFQTPYPMSADARINVVMVKSGICLCAYCSTKYVASPVATGMQTPSATYFACFFFEPILSEK